MRGPRKIARMRPLHLVSYCPDATCAAAVKRAAAVPQYAAAGALTLEVEAVIAERRQSRRCLLLTRP